MKNAYQFFRVVLTIVWLIKLNPSWGDSEVITPEPNDTDSKNKTTVATDEVTPKSVEPEKNASEAGDSVTTSATPKAPSLNFNGYDVSKGTVAFLYI